MATGEYREEKNLTDTGSHGQKATRRIVLGAALGVTLACTGFAIAADAPPRMLETGSTLLYPLFNLWVPDYTKAHAGASNHDARHGQRHRHFRSDFRGSRRSAHPTPI